jgi:uncharacterized phage protein (TIGR01671 family)
VRKIRFRGFGISDKRWHYGFLTIYESGKCIVGGFEVYSESIGQYTGLKDNNCNDIYEGDIVQINGHNFTVAFEIGSFMLVRMSDETDMYDQFKNCWNDDVYPLAQLHWESNDEEDTLANCIIIGNEYKS